jgi:hypothetical protein
MATINPEPANPGGGSGGGTPVNETATPTNPVESLSTGFSDLISLLTENPTLSISLVLIGAAVFYFYKQYQSNSQLEYDGKNWKEEIIGDLKWLINNAGLDTNKDLTRGDVTELGKVHKYDIQKMPEDSEYRELVFGELDEEEEDIDLKEVYVFMVTPSGTVNKSLWTVTDLWLDMDSSTKFYVVSEESFEEERTRYKLREDIQFKREYDNIMMEKGIATENLTDQYPLYQARKNIVEGLEEFSMKTLFLDRTHSASIAQKREDMDEQELLDKLLRQGKSH